MELDSYEPRMILKLNYFNQLFVRRYAGYFKTAVRKFGAVGVIEFPTVTMTLVYKRVSVDTGAS